MQNLRVALCRPFGGRRGSHTHCMQLDCDKLWSCCSYCCLMLQSFSRCCLGRSFEEADASRLAAKDATEGGVLSCGHKHGLSLDFTRAV